MRFGTAWSGQRSFTDSTQLLWRAWHEIESKRVGAPFAHSNGQTDVIPDRIFQGEAIWLQEAGTYLVSARLPWIFRIEPIADYQAIGVQIEMALQIATENTG